VVTQSSINSSLGKKAPKIKPNIIITKPSLKLPSVNHLFHFLDVIYIAKTLKLSLFTSLTD
jgi:hypothetical protein